MFTKIPVEFQAVLKLLEATTLVTQRYISGWHQVLKGANMPHRHVTAHATSLADATCYDVMLSNHLTTLK
jgi:hypothetical protein